MDDGAISSCSLYPECSHCFTHRRYEEAHALTQAKVDFIVDWMGRARGQSSY